MVDRDGTAETSEANETREADVLDEDEIDRLLDLAEQERTRFDPPLRDTPEEIINGARRNVDGRFTTIDPPNYKDDSRRLQLSAEQAIKCAEKFPMILEAVLRMRTLEDALRATKRLRARTAELECALVTYARVYGWSWQDIADAMGQPRQTIHRRFARKTNRSASPDPFVDGSPNHG